VVMKDGWIQQVGEPLELYSHPANRVVAGFIGSP
jgi:multiple sugar transport system ATP-binding protein